MIKGHYSKKDIVTILHVYYNKTNKAKMHNHTKEHITEKVTLGKFKWVITSPIHLATSSKYYSYFITPLNK